MHQKILNWHKEHRNHLTMGERAADRMRNGMGSWRFVFAFLIFMAIWAWLNTHGSWNAWDVFPFILLNLFLSMLAGLQGAILLIAAKRADAVSAAMAEHDYRTNVAAAKDIEYLMELNQEQLKLIKELSSRLNKADRDDRPHA
ncbi:MAG: hypothetical protein JWN82_591 [Candidatus Saccharibacteria bacterium]|nr:hypothetical protein [Candidatus Saccharibacteria bacterium]